MKRNQTGIFSTRNLVLMAALIAMQIILARFLSIQPSDTLRISFEGIPVILAGLWLGPAGGALVALIADILGTVIHGYGAWFPPIAIGPVMVGYLCGISSRHFLREDLAENRGMWKVAATVLVVGILNSFVVGLCTTTLYSIMVMGNTTAFDVLLWTNLLQRLGTKPITILVDTVMVITINRAVYKPVVRRIVAPAR